MPPPGPQDGHVSKSSSDIRPSTATKNVVQGVRTGGHGGGYRDCNARDRMRAKLAAKRRLKETPLESPSPEPSLLSSSLSTIKETPLTSPLPSVAESPEPEPKPKPSPSPSPSPPPPSPPSPPSHSPLIPLPAATVVKTTAASRKKLLKNIKAIANLKVLESNGTSLNPEQKAKVAKEEEWLAQIESIEQVQKTAAPASVATEELQNPITKTGTKRKRKPKKKSKKKKKIKQACGTEANTN